MDNDEMHDLIAQVWNCHESAAGAAIDSKQPDSLLSNMARAKLIELVVSLYHRTLDLEERIEALERSNHERI